MNMTKNQMLHILIDTQDTIEDVIARIEYAQFNFKMDIETENSIRQYKDFLTMSNLFAEHAFEVLINEDYRPNTIAYLRYRVSSPYGSAKTYIYCVVEQHVNRISELVQRERIHSRYNYYMDAVDTCDILNQVAKIKFNVKELK